MAHESKYGKTRDGYILDIEEMTGANLPKAYHRLAIATAFELWEVTRVYGLPGLQNQAGKIGLPLIPVQLKMENLDNENRQEKNKKS